MTEHRQPLEVLVGSIRALLEEVDQKFQVRLLSTGGVSCREGCCCCCHWPVAASPLEGMVLLEHLIATRQWSKRTKSKIEAAADRVTGLAYDVWLAANLPCPLLNDGRCIAWEARPMACRVTASKGDPVMCHPHKMSVARGLVDFASFMSEFRSREVALLRAQGQKIHTLPLPTALLVAAQIKEAGLDAMPVLTMAAYFQRMK